MARKKKGDSQKRIGEKISLLRSEGKSEKAAVGEAEGMEHSESLGRHGTYYRTPRKRSRRRQ